MTNKNLLSKFFYSCILVVILFTTIHFVNKNKKHNIIIQNRCVVRNFNNDEIVLPSRVVNLLYINQYYHLSKKDSTYLKNFIDNGR